MLRLPHQIAPSVTQLSSEVSSREVLGMVNRRASGRVEVPQTLTKHCLGFVGREDYLDVFVH
jgi:hypothetical protein